jgi:hypothetical protein
MASTVCPQCKNTIMRGFWEILDKCPACGADWAVDPGARPRMVKKVTLLALACGLGCFIPVAGCLFALAALGLGFLALRMGRRTAGVTAMVLAIMIGLAGQSLLIYKGYGYLSDRGYFPAPATQPASQPASGPATAPASQPSTSPAQSPTS